MKSRGFRPSLIVERIVLIAFFAESALPILPLTIVFQPRCQSWAPLYTSPGLDKLFSVRATLFC